jgi:type II secretory pathway component PulJ
MMRLSGNNHGFTLIEAIISGTVGVVIATSLVMFYTMYSKAVNDGTANAMIQQQAENVYDQISRDVHNSALVLASTEVWTTTPSAVAMIVTEIRCFNAAGLIFAAYKIENGYLKEARPNPPAAAPGAWQSFTTGGGNQIGIATGGNFTLAALRRSVTINLPLSFTYRTVVYTLPSRNEVAGCRN